MTQWLGGLGEMGGQVWVVGLEESGHLGTGLRGLVSGHGHWGAVWHGEGHGQGGGSVCGGGA